MCRRARSKAVLPLALAAFLGWVARSRTESAPPVEAPSDSQEAKPLPAAQAPAPVVEVAPAPVPYDPEHVSEKRREAAKKITLLDPDQFPEAPRELRQAFAGKMASRAGLAGLS